MADSILSHTHYGNVSPFQKLEKILIKQSNNPLKYIANKSYEYNSQLIQSRGPIHGNIEEEFGKKKNPYTQPIQNNIQHLMAKTPMDDFRAYAKRKPDSRAYKKPEINDLIRNNFEDHSDFGDKETLNKSHSGIKVFPEMAQKNQLEITDQPQENPNDRGYRRNKVQNKTVQDFEDGKLWWTKDTGALVQKMKREILTQKMPDDQNHYFSEGYIEKFFTEQDNKQNYNSQNVGELVKTDKSWMNPKTYEYFENMENKKNLWLENFRSTSPILLCQKPISDDKKICKKQIRSYKNQRQVSIFGTLPNYPIDYENKENLQNVHNRRDLSQEDIAGLKENKSSRKVSRKKWNPQKKGNNNSNLLQEIVFNRAKNDEKDIDERKDKSKILKDKRAYSCFIRRDRNIIANTHDIEIPEERLGRKQFLGYKNATRNSNIEFNDFN